MNGTRFVVRNMYDHSLDLESITGQGTDQRILLPRIDLTPSDSTLPFSFTRRQFPIRIAFAMTINKAQGQTLDKVGLCLPLCLVMVNFMLPCPELDLLKS